MPPAQVNTWDPDLNKLYKDLQHRNEDVRFQTAKSMQNMILTYQRNLPREKFVSFIRDLQNIISKLVNGNTVPEKTGGLLGVAELINIDLDENVSKLNRMANFIHVNLATNDFAVNVLAAKAFGMLLTKTDGSLRLENAEREITRALEALKEDKMDVKRHTAVLVLHEAVTNAPTYFYEHINPMMATVFTTLTDTKLTVREHTRSLVEAALLLTKKRGTAMHALMYNTFYDACKNGIAGGKEDVMHGSLLGIQAMLNLPRAMEDDRFQEISTIIMNLKGHKSMLIRRTVIDLMPCMASCRPRAFDRLHLLEACMAHFLHASKREDEVVSATFLSMGNLCKILGSQQSLLPYLREIIPMVKEGLIVKKGHQVPPEVLQCISMVADGCGSALEKHAPEILPHMIAAGLSETLVGALASLARVGNIRPMVQEQLLELISKRLREKLTMGAERVMGKREKSITELRKPHMRSLGRTLSVTDRRGSGSSVHNIPPSMDLKEIVVLALKTLATFDLESQDLTEFIRSTVMPFLDDRDSSVRRYAAQTSAKLVIPLGESGRPQGRSAPIVYEVIEKLLIVGITDPVSIVRCTVLESLDTRYDYLLAKSENLRSLFMALNDETFMARELSITIIGRLAVRNPADVMPSLRKTLIQLLTQLEYSGDRVNQEESARLLGHLFGSSGSVLKPYVKPLSRALLSQLKNSPPSVGLKVLDALGRLSYVAGDELTPHLPTLMPIIIEYLQDQGSAQKREVAIVCLGQICSATGYVIQPLLDYSVLLDILLAALHTEQSSTVRMELLRALGILGALDPYRHKAVKEDTSEHKDTGELVDAAGYTDLTEGYFIEVALSALGRVLADQSLRLHHADAVNSVVYIFKCFGMKVRPYLPVVIPSCVAVVHSCNASMRVFMLQQLRLMVSSAKDGIHAYVGSIFQLVSKFWESDLIHVIKLMSEISAAIDEEVKAFLPNFIPKMLHALHTDDTADRGVTLAILRALEIFGTNVEDYLHLVFPAVARLVDNHVEVVSIRVAGLQLIRNLCYTLDFSEYASRICHPLARILSDSGQGNELSEVALETLCAIAFQLDSDYAIFIPMINKILTQKNIHHSNYDAVVSIILKNQSLQGEELNAFQKRPQLQRTRMETQLQIEPAKGFTKFQPVEVKAFKVDEDNLKNACKAPTQGATKDDWVEWLRRFSVELLKESPNPALRACLTVAQQYQPLARELFNVAFIACWNVLQDSEGLAENLSTVLKSPHIPPEVLQALLNLAEFMEHEGKSLPINNSLLQAKALECHAYAKALHYQELEFRRADAIDPAAVESLISINNQLQQPEVAIGILVDAQRKCNLELKETWYEKLERWDDALKAYREKSQADPTDLEFMFGQMRCLRALCKWVELAELAEKAWENTPQAEKEAVKTDNRTQRIALLGAEASWNLSDWEAMDDFVKVIEPNSVSGAFYRAVLSVHHSQFPMAVQLVNQARKLIDTELTGLVGESYNRAYETVVRVQMLSELEEVIEYKTRPERAPMLRQIWTARLKGCQNNVDVWQRVLAVRSLVLPPRADVELRLRYSSLCRKSERLSHSYRIIMELLGSDKETITKKGLPRSTDPRIAIAYCKLLWTNEAERPTAIKILQEHVAALPVDNPHLSECHRRLGDFCTQMAQNGGNFSEASMSQVLKHYRMAAKHCPNSYKAWHKWALMNFEAVNLQKTEKQSNTLPKNRRGHLVHAIKGFFRSIMHGTDKGSGRSLQDTLRLLTLWFNYGHLPEAEQALHSGFSTVPIDTWLEVVPQVIARIDSSNATVRRMTVELLSSIGREHPQALVYPLTVASVKSTGQTTDSARQSAARFVLEKMRTHSPAIVEQAQMVSEELVRVSITWHELWREALEDASNSYFKDNAVEPMLQALLPLHKMMDVVGPASVREEEFARAFARTLNEAYGFLKKFMSTKNLSCLYKAWDLYFRVFVRIDKNLPHMKTLDLSYVSPSLLEARDLELAVPATYEPGCDIVRIQSFAAKLTVILSKQRPRKCSMFGSNGVQYTFLLKGHEDLRQDERVMQLFSLVNTLLSNDPTTAKSHLNIMRYAVVPLSQNTGLIGWVPNTDTMNALITSNRQGKKMEVKIEHRRMTQMNPTYVQLPLINKVEVFQFGLDGSSGDDFHMVLWQRARNAETWLERRTNFTRSLAVMSMIGYILGLGDRHLSNIMIERNSGRVLHIDFGDCFEVAMQRAKFPEKVPFRLTRMFEVAMGVSGVEGSFRSTCQDTMRVMHEHKESLMAVLEAFVYDPLLGWKLLARDEERTAAQAKNLDDSNTTPSLGLVGESHGMDTDGSVMRTGDSNIPPMPTNSMSVSSRRLMYSSLNSVDSRMDQTGQDTDGINDELNQRALTVLNRVQAKLTGRDFSTGKAAIANTDVLDVRAQVQRLIEQATSHENLCQAYQGWSPFW